MSKKVIVLGEFRDGSLRNVTFEAIAAGKTVAEGGEVIGVLFGESVSSHAAELIHYGADRVLTAENPLLKNYTSDGYVQALLPIIERENPDVIIFGHTSMGKDLSPKLSARMGTGL
ncbi:electron transfer flavoprotein subunit alpha, partial [Bacillus licheniformis]